MSKYAVTIDERHFELDFDLPLRPGEEFSVKIGGHRLRVRIPAVDGLEWIIIDDRPYELHLDAGLHRLQDRTDMHPLEVHDRDTARARPASTDGRIKAPIPGTIARLLIEAGQSVELGQPIAILEAMKMENEVRAPRAGIIGSIHVEPGMTVKRGELLAEVV